MDLNEQEQQFYGEQFQICDSEGSGRIGSMKAMEFFITSGINQDILSQIHELCGAKRLGHFGRSQFYIALKLISLAQCGLPVKLEHVFSGKEMALPQFSKSSEQEQLSSPGPQVNTVNQEYAILSVQERSGQQQTGQLPPPPIAKKLHTRSLSGQYRSDSLQQQFASQAQNNSRDDTSPLDSKSPQFSPKQSPPTSPGVVSAMPNLIATPVSSGGGGGNILQPQPGVQISAGGYVNSGLISDWLLFEDEENHGLLGTGPKKAYDALEPVGIDSSSMSSDPESVDDVWTITEEQRTYYVTQFKTMQPDPSGVIVGSVAKEFFEKSKLPLKELSKIWQLSDLNRDGALSVEEFCIAMHLVVLRRYDVELPDHLPFSLMPYATLTNDEPFAADLAPGSTLRRMSQPETPPVPTQPLSQSPPVPQALWVAEFTQESQATTNEVMSPAMKPVNFEFQKPVAVDPESKIIHPVPMRVSQDCQSVTGERFDRDPTSVEPSNLPISPTSLAKPRSNTESFSETSQNDLISGNKITNVQLQSRPRPVSLKVKSVPGDVRSLVFPLSISSQGFESGDKPLFPTVDSLQEPEPPVPPPRQQQHNRRRSEDLKGLLHPPPAVPPRISPKEGQSPWKAVDGSMFADFKTFDSIPSHDESTEIISQDESQVPNADSIDGAVPVSSDLQKGDECPEIGDAGVGEELFAMSDVMVKSATSIQEGLEGTDNAEDETYPVRHTSSEKRDLQMRLRTHRERNSGLMRLNSELNQELQEVMEQRIALEINLEHLRPFPM